MSIVFDDLKSSLPANLPHQTELKKCYEIPVSNIQFVQSVLYYSTETTLLYPLVLKTPDSCHCIDGREYVLQAIRDGKEKIMCEVIEVSETSLEDLAIRVVASRIETLGGRAPFVEKLKLINQLTIFLMGSNESLVLLRHGGRRCEKDFDNNPENDVPILIANRLNIPRDRVIEYLNYGRYLTDEVFDTAIAEYKTKKFFREIQPAKRSFICDLQQKSLSNDAIMKEVSNFVMGKIFPSRPTDTLQSSENNIISGDDKHSVREPEVEVVEDNYDGVRAKIDKKEPDFHERTVSDIQDDLKTASAELYRYLNTTVLDEFQVNNHVVAHIEKLIKLRDEYYALVSTSGIDLKVREVHLG